jgi:F-type H+-transporting ATPase subunit b
MELLKLLSASELVAQIIAFLFLFFVLRRFFWSRVLKLLDERKAYVASQFKQIEDTKLEMVKMKDDYSAQLATIKQKANEQIAQAVMEGHKLTEEIKHKAHQEAQSMIESARVSISYDLARAKEDLKETVIDLALKVTEKVIEEKYTEEKDRKQIEAFLDGMDKI